MPPRPEGSAGDGREKPIPENKMKITKSRLKQIIKEELETTLEEGHGGKEAWPKVQLQRIGELADMIHNNSRLTNLEEWVESKITKALDYLSSVMNYMRGEDDETAMTKPMVSSNVYVGKTASIPRILKQEF